MSLSDVQLDYRTLVRRRWRIVGQVQGVGFRPFVYRLAQEQRLTGFVRNDSAGVLIEGQGQSRQLDDFAAMLRARKPALAVISEITCSTIPVCAGETVFEIKRSSDQHSSQAEVTVDTAVCPDCLAELFDEHNHRYKYGLINCTNCGPRYSIIRRVPYDRPNTTMADFEMCPTCHAEYADPSDRRFHAQPVACHTCGPRVSLVDTAGRLIEGQTIDLAVRRLLAGQILAIKGLGGFHLAVRADDSQAVGRLRRLKHRSQKPFAVMCRSISEAQKVVDLSDGAIEAMLSPACPIVLAPRRPDAPIAAEVAPGNHRLGVMLPYTPIQHLLFNSESGVLGPLVMTSANISDEPLVIDNAEAVKRLSGICDAILWHDRPIERPVDDSVFVDMGKADPLPIRRARGYVPGAIALPSRAAMAGLCVGAELKNTVAVVRGARAILSHHMGDLLHAAAYGHFQRAIDDLCQLFGVRPQWIAHDLHPQYLSTAWAGQLSQKSGVGLIGVQHHHAHAAAVLAEHGHAGPALAVVCDGVGYGTDGTMWGGELLLADLKEYRRLGHLKPMLLAGGDAAARDSRRCALALLYQAYGEDFADRPVARRMMDDEQQRTVLANMIRSGFRCVLSSGAGRVFDGVAALLGVCSHNTYEAEAAMKLESAAAGAPMRYEEELFRIEGGDIARIDLAPLVRMLVGRVEEGWPVPELAACFHDQFVLAWETLVMEAVQRTGIRCVALSGGVFCNERLTDGLISRLERRGLLVLRHRLVPPNDGGVAYGQAAVACARINSER